MGIIILDRDGVINEDSDAFIKSVDEWVALPGSLDAMARLNRGGFDIHVATNQSGIWRGLLTEDDLCAMHDKLCAELAGRGGTIASIRYCPHGPDEGCDCRKPRPGMYLRIADDAGVALRNVPVVGDALRDLQAAEAVGAMPILVRTGKGERTLAAGGLPPRTRVFDNLAAVADALLC